MDFAIYVLLAGVGATIAGLALQMASHALFTRYKRGDSKELAGVVGFRVAAIWGIAVGLIFAASAAHLIEAKRNLLEEARLIKTLQFLTAEAPSLQERATVQQQLGTFAERSVEELDSPTSADGPARATSDLLLKICRKMAPAEQDSVDLRWTKEEFQRSCRKLIDLRGKKRVGARQRVISTPFWIFFAISSAFLAFLFGVFEPRLLNIVFTGLFFFATGVTGMIIFAASDPYHDPVKISSEPLLELLPKTSPLRSP